MQQKNKIKDKPTGLIHKIPGITGRLPQKQALKFGKRRFPLYLCDI